MRKMDCKSVSGGPISFIGLTWQDVAKLKRGHSITLTTGHGVVVGIFALQFDAEIYNALAIAADGDDIIDPQIGEME